MLSNQSGLFIDLGVLNSNNQMSEGLMMFSICNVAFFTKGL